MKIETNVMLIPCKLSAASQSQPSEEWCPNTAPHWTDVSQHKCIESSRIAVTGFLVLKDTANRQTEH